jgi:hypothetical protein
MIVTASIESATGIESRVPLPQLTGFQSNAPHSSVLTHGRPLALVRRGNAIIGNVIVSNDCNYSGVFEHPAIAHTKYIQNSPVAKPSRKDAEHLLMRKELSVPSS